MFKYLTPADIQHDLCNVVSIVKRNVMGLTILDDELYVVYHSTPAVHVYSISLNSATSRPTEFNRSAPRVLDTTMVWPRGIAANPRTKKIFAVDWTSIFSGKLYKLSAGGGVLNVR